MIAIRSTLLIVACATFPLQAATKLEYNRDIRPILAENCFSCHGPDSASRKADLRLDQRDDAIAKKAILPGNSKESELVARLYETDPETIMPPPKTHKKLNDAQKQLLKRWVEEGAEYQPHWSFITPKRPAVPTVKNQHWGKNAIDQFILAELEKRNLTPAPEADRRTLARRLSFDLTGLPPEPAQVEAFVKDAAPDAYEKYVDLLLKSPTWGEHRGRYWLDAARFADTHGIHFDNYREMWSYREWVINALNSNMKFDEFTIQQLAGDLLPNPTVDQILATGFNRCNITTNEGGAISEEYLVLYNRDRTETTSTVWMGLTAGCAVCHDHKFDPISMKEFYSLAAFFNNTTQNAMDGNIPNTPPIITVPKSEDRPRFEQVGKEITEVRKALEARRAAAKPEFQKWLNQAKVDDLQKKVPTEKLQFLANLNEGTGKEITVQIQDKSEKKPLPNQWEWTKPNFAKKSILIQDGSNLAFGNVGDFERDQPFSVSSWVRLTKRGVTGAIVGRMNGADNYKGWDLWVQNDKVGMHIIHKWQDDAIKVVSKTALNPNKWYHVSIQYDGTSKASGIRLYLDGEQVPFDIEADSLKSTIKTQVPFKLGQRDQTEKISNVAIQDLRVYSKTLNATEVKALSKNNSINQILAKEASKRTPKENDELYTWWLGELDTTYNTIAQKIEALQAEEVAIKSRGTIAHVMQEKPAEAMAYVLNRGEYDQRRDAVKPATPKVLPAFKNELPKNRLGFAKWLLSADHPLTARVTVNRFWQEIFGIGIVRTTGDFGVTGDQPTHPELLDWLAIEFRESGWDMKQFFKLIVTSATYRQAAITTKEKLEKDPNNRYLSRGARFRMDAEMIRDNALAVSGLLIRKLGGPSVKPYQPEGVWEAVAMIGSNTRDYRKDSGENLYRRSLYTFWKRSAPPAALDVLNAPNRETCTVRRERTNTPLQALLTLNDIQFVEAARVLAEKAIKASSSDVERVHYISQRLLSRNFNATELQIVQQSLQALKADFQSKPEEAKKLIAYGDSKADAQIPPQELAAWTMLANQLLNLDEVLCK